jgi:exosortase
MDTVADAAPVNDAATAWNAETKKWVREWAIILGLLCAAFYPVLVWMYERWTAADSYTSHGFLVPLISGFFIYRQRHELARTERRPSKWGLALLILGLLVFIGGGLLRVYFTSGFALVVCLTGILAYWGGWNWVRKLWFPLVFLVFMLPLPEVAIARMNLTLKLLVTKCSVLGAEMVGVPVVMEGAKLHLEQGTMVVGDVCSGLRSMVALVALGALYAYLYGQKSWLVRISILAAVLPAAILGNMLRIFLNIVFAHFFGTELLFRPLIGSVDIHMLSGFLVFAFALLALHLTMMAAEAFSEDDEQEKPGKLTGTSGLLKNARPLAAAVPNDLRKEARL